MIIVRKISCYLNGFYRNKLLSIGRSIIKDDNLFAKKISSMCMSSQKPQKYDYLLILDFEATCDKGNDRFVQEIIEFPVLKFNTKTLQVESIFHQYVSPVINANLTTFCVELTGIIPEMLVNQPTLPDVLHNFDDWLHNQGLMEDVISFVFLTSGDWDLKSMLPKDCNNHGVEVPEYMKKWINLKRPFASTTGTWPKSLMAMINHFGLIFEGRHHSGIDDCQNISRVVKELLLKGCVMDQMTHL